MMPTFEDKLILLIENDPDDGALTMRAFKRNNIRSQVVTARSGVEALNYLVPANEPDASNQPLVPDLILLDLKLPQMSGFEVLRRLRAQEMTRLLPIIVLSSSREPRDIRDSYALGANSYICKPIDLDDLDKMVRLLVDYWLIVNEHPLAQ
jgi:two-component system, response regulator